MSAFGRGLLLAGRCRALAQSACRRTSLASNANDASTSGRTFSASSGEVQALRQELLMGALSHVKERGWTAAALVAAAHDLKLSPAVTGILSRGEGELVEYFMDDCNQRCVEQIAARKEELQLLPLDERVARALQIRLELVAPYVDSWPQALAVAARPSNAPHSLKLLFSMVDDIWAALGDESTDLTWYSKRAALAGIYTSTSLYMLTDYSPGFQDTWAALRRRVAEGLALDASVQRVVHSASAAATSAAAAAGAAAGEAGAAQQAGAAAAGAASPAGEAAASSAAAEAASPAAAGTGGGASVGGTAST